MAILADTALNKIFDDCILLAPTNVLELFRFLRGFILYSDPVVPHNEYSFPSYVLVY